MFIYSVTDTYLPYICMAGFFYSVLITYLLYFTLQIQIHQLSGDNPSGVIHISWQCIIYTMSSLNQSVFILGIFDNIRTQIYISDMNGLKSCEPIR